MTREKFISSFTNNKDMLDKYPDDVERLNAATAAWNEESVYKDGASFDSIYSVTKSISESVYKYDEVTIMKSKSDQNLVFGWANVSILDDGNIPLDWQGDITAPYVLEQAAYDFVLNYRETGEMHVGECKGQLIESVMFTEEKMEAIGIPVGQIPVGWWVGFYIPDDYVFEKIKTGQYKMFSIQGQAKKIAL